MTLQELYESIGGDYSQVMRILRMVSWSGFWKQDRGRIRLSCSRRPMR